MTTPDTAPPIEDRPEGERLAALGLIVTTVSRLPDLFVPMIAAVYGTRGSDLGVIPVIAVVLMGSLLLRWLSWTRFRYFVGGDDIRIEQGLLGRTARSVPYDRIADVSVEQPALARVLGLAVVRFETGAGKGEDAELRFVAEAEAERLRETVRARKSGIEAQGAGSDQAAGAPAGRLLFAMDTARLLTLGIYSFSLVIFAVLLGAAQQLDFLLPFDWDDVSAWIGLAGEQGRAVSQLETSTQLLGVVAALAGLIVLGLGSGIVRTVLTDWGFRLERTPKGLRRRRGLLTLTDVTIPVARVQAVEIGTGPVRAMRGWHDLRLVSLASESAREAHHTVAPLARLDEIWPIIREVRLAPPTAEIEFVQPPYGPWLDHSLIGATPFVVAAALAVAANLPAAGLLALPALAIAASGAMAWHFTRRSIDADQLYALRGWWNRSLSIARQHSVQAVTLSRGPLEQLRGLATVHFGIPGGELHFRAVPLAEARAIRAAVLATITPIDFSELSRAQ